jgi:hypothetical protein
METNLHWINEKKTKILKDFENISGEPLVGIFYSEMEDDPFGITKIIRDLSRHSASTFLHIFESEYDSMSIVLENEISILKVSTGCGGFKDEDLLRMMIAHEIGHQYQSKRIGSQSFSQFLLSLRRKISSKRGWGYRKFIEKVAYWFRRRSEFIADEFAMKHSTKKGVALFFKNLEEIHPRPYRQYDAVPERHPPTEERARRCGVNYEHL